MNCENVTIWNPSEDDINRLKEGGNGVLAEAIDRLECQRRYLARMLAQTERMTQRLDAIWMEQK